MISKILSVLFFFIAFSSEYICTANQEMKIKLKPAHFKEQNLKSVLDSRYSCRNFQDKALNLEQIASIIWASYGLKYDSVTGASKTVPSAGATYPLEIYLLVGKNSVEKLKEGIYRYIIEEHSLEIIAEGEKRSQLAKACLGQDFITQAPVSLIIAAKFSRTTQRYGERGKQYVYMEAGHAGQNAYLAVTALGLNTVEVGAFIDEDVKRVLNLDKSEELLLIMPIGYCR